eukprot:6190384-Pleurochrysis_carterae.AAC.3
MPRWWGASLGRIEQSVCAESSGLFATQNTKASLCTGRLTTTAESAVGRRQAVTKGSPSSPPHAGLVRVAALGARSLYTASG